MKVQIVGIRALFDSLKWLLHDIASKHFLKLIVIVFSSLAGVGLQAGAFILITLFIRKLENTFPSNIFLLSVFVCLLFILAAMLTFWSKKVTAEIVREYEINAVINFFEKFLLGKLMLNKKTLEHFNDKFVARLLTKDVRYCGRAVNELLQVFTSIVPGLIAIIVLFIMEPFFTLVLLFLGLLIIPLYYLLSIKASGILKDIEKYSRQDALDKMNIFNYFNNFHDNPTALKWSKLKLFQGSSRLYLNAYELRLKIAHKSILITNLAMAIVITVTILYFVVNYLKGNTSLNQIFLYIVLLQYIVRSNVSFGKQLTNLVVFFPSFSRYVQLMVDNKDQVYIEAEHIVELFRNDIMDFRTGERISLVFNKNLNKVNMIYLISALIDNEKNLRNILLSSAFINSNYEFFGDSLQLSFNLPQNFSYKEILTMYPGSNLANKFKKQVEPYIENSNDQIRWEKIDTKLKFILSALSVSRSNSNVVFVEERGLSLLDESERAITLELFNNKKVFIVYGVHVERVGKYGENFYASIIDDRIVTCGKVNEYEKISELYINSKVKTDLTIVDLNAGEEVY